MSSDRVSELEAQLASMTERVERAEGALREVAAYEPDYSGLPEVPSHEGCVECAKWVGHPVQRGLCDEGYRQMDNRVRARASIDSAQHYHMRDIAARALAKSLSRDEEME